MGPGLKETVYGQSAGTCLGRCGVLAKIAAEIAKTESNIESVSLEPTDSSAYAEINFTVLVANRLHLARVMRGLRSVPEVVRVTRLKS